MKRTIIISRDAFGKFGVYSPYDKKFIAGAKALGAKWNDGVWVFPDDKIEEAFALVQKIYGLTDDQIRFKKVVFELDELDIELENSLSSSRMNEIEGLDKKLKKEYRELEDKGARI